jgi:cation:H+ antiporter
MLITIIQAVAGLGMLYLGGEALVRGASALALRLGMSSLAIGLTVVAFGTSMPELIVSVDATLKGLGDIAIGNVVGSNIANVALILGIATVLRPSVVEAKVVRFDAPLMVAVSFTLALALFDGAVSRWEGIVLLIGLVGYTGFTFWESKRETDSVQDEFSSAVPVPQLGIAFGALLVVAGLAMLLGGGHLLVVSAVDLATTLGVSQAIIGLTIVAIGTSLPELVTSVVASLRGQGDIAIGNVVGSNIFNILGIVGTAAIIDPLRIGGVTWTDVGSMCALACLLVFILFVRPRLGRVEGLVFLSCYILYLGVLVSP